MKPGPGRRDGFPFDVPALAAIEQLELDAPVTLLAGDNGTGYEDLEAVRLTRGFLEARERFICAALEE